MVNRDSVDPYLQFVEPFYVGKDAAHDFRHIQRIVGRLAALAEDVMPAPRSDVMYFLASFHGLVDLIASSPDFSDRAHDFLRQLGWPEQEVGDGFRRLQRHLKSPLTVEEQIVHDANYVELLGAFGIAKAFTKGGAEGQAYEETADIFEHQFLDTVEFKTPVGKQMAAEQRACTKEFLARLRAEL